MIRVKGRYVVVKLRFEEDRKVSLGESLAPVIKSRLAMDFGSHAVAMAGHLSVVEYLPHSQIAIVKCDAPACKYVLFTIATIGEVSNIKCSMSILWVSGVLKRAMRRILKHVESEKKMALQTR